MLYTETDYNNELCNFEQLTEETRIKVLRKDLLFLISKGKKDVTVTELELDVIAHNQSSFDDILSHASCKEVYCTLAEKTVYYFELIRGGKNEENF